MISVSSIANIEKVRPRMRTPEDDWFPALMVVCALTAIPVRQQSVQRRAIASASVSAMSLRRLKRMKSSREVMTCGRFEMVKTVEPCEEKVEATVWSSRLMIVTAEITAATRTTTPTSVSAVRSLFARKEASAMRNDSQVLWKTGGSRGRRARVGARDGPTPLGARRSSFMAVSSSVAIASSRRERVYFYGPPVAFVRGGVCGKTKDAAERVVRRVSKNGF